MSTDVDARTLLEHDQLLVAIAKVSQLPEDHPDRMLVRTHMAHVASPEAYRDYYRTVMRGQPCPEEEVFRRHEQVRRFSVIRQRILERKHTTVLDLGCLDGWCLLNLAASGVRGVGVDLNAEALAVGRERANKWGFDLTFDECAIEGFNAEHEAGFFPGVDFPLRFEAVILSEVLEHVLDPVTCLKVAANHLAPGGIVYISVPATPIPHHGKLEDAREHLRLYTEADVVALARQAGLWQVVDHEVIPEEDQGIAFANRTISFRQAVVSVYCNYITGGWEPDRLEEVGGSEEMVVRVAEAWARQGHHVEVHRNPVTRDHTTVNGVQYRPRTDAPREDADALIVFKTLDYVDRATAFWTTDLPAEGAAAAFLPPKIASQLSAVLCISEYQRTELLKACPWLDPTKVSAHWLGIDPTEIADTRDVTKIAGRVIHASSPDRGLAHLLEIWPTVRDAVPTAELHVTYGFWFWEKSEAVLPTDQAVPMRIERQRLHELLTQPGVVNHGRLNREDFLRLMASAEVWAYPCIGGELCCKTALEAQVLQCLPVVVPTMALDETVQAGIKTTPERFAEALVMALRGEGPQIDWSQVRIPSWNDLAQWVWTHAQGTLVRPVGPNGSPAESVMVEVQPERFVMPTRTTAPETGLDILLAARGMPFDGETDRERSLGGSETAALQLSRELVKRGHRVTVFSHLPEGRGPGKQDGVVYLPIQDFQRYAGATAHDVAIVQRDPMGLNQPLVSKLNILWCHDLGLSRYRHPFRSSMWNCDYVVPVSHWHGHQLRQVYDLPPEIIVPMRNGIDLEAIRRASDRKGVRDAKALVFAARPERGLDLLLQSVFPRLLERDPRLTLYVAGYDNTTQEMAPFYDHCRQLIASLGQRAKWMGHLKKAELYGLYSRARVYVYPSRSFKEVSCLRGDALVDMPRDYWKYPQGVPIKELVGKSGFPVYCYDAEAHAMTLSQVKWVKKTRRNAPIWRLLLDDGSELHATGDHLIMQRDESWKRLDMLKPGDSLMPLYKTLTVGVNLNNGKSINEHRLVAQWLAGRMLDSREHADHIDGDSWNNDPTNLQVLEYSEHMRKTMRDAVAAGRVGNAVARRRQSARMKAFFDTSAGKQHAEAYLGRVGGRALWAQFQSAEEKAKFCQRREASRSAEANVLRQQAGFVGNPEARMRAIRNSHTPLHRHKQSDYMRNEGSAKANAARWNHRVVSVERAGYADVYDMEVEKYHNFVAGGIVVHNCISAMEAAACGLPFVASALGALPETTALCPGFFELVPHPGREATEDYLTRFVDAVWRVLSDDLLHKRLSEAGRTGAAAYSWVDVAREWEDFLIGAIEMRSRDPRRLVRHWWRLGDLNGIAALPEAYRVVGLTSQQRQALDTLPPDLPPPPSAGVLGAMVQAAADAKPKTVLGIGAHGDTIARHVAKTIGAQAVEQPPADFVIGVETLDCALDPAAHLREVEAKTTPGGFVCLVVASPGTHQDRLHQGTVPRRRRWVFDGHDIRELLGGRKDLLAVVVGGGGQSSYDMAPLAWSLYRFRAGGPMATLDLARRQWLQSPRLSLSACLIVKDEEGTLNRCLRSIRPWVDELIVDDNGSQDSTGTILERYGASVMAGRSPLDVGFDEARNATIVRATGDAILWIDADEELLEPHHLPKYLRWNMFSGYAVAQHHFSAVPPNAFKPDLPVRVFRRTKLDGSPSGIRFYGVVHEHPEVAINHSVGYSVVLSDVHISHMGYLTETVRRKRFQRNITLMFRDRAKYPDRLLGKFLMVRDWCHLARYEVERNGRQLTPQAVQYLEAAVAAYQQDFLGATHVMAADGLAYYNEALQHLNRGFEVGVTIKVGALDGAPHELVYNGRVASPEDLLKLVSSGAKELASVWDGEYI